MLENYNVTTLKRLARAHNKEVRTQLIKDIPKKTKE